MKILIWALIVLWIAAVAYYGYSTLPAMPLDLGGDAATRAAFDRAVATHAAYWAAVALVPAFLAWIVARLFAK